MRQLKISKGRALAFLLILGLIFIPVSFQAKELGEQEVRAAVETWVRYVTADARPDAMIEKMEPYFVKGKPVAYIAHLSGGGFCLCGADDRVLPVYFYNPSGTYDPKNPAYQFILWEIDTRLTALYHPEPIQAEALSQRQNLWQDLIAGRIPKPPEGEAAAAEPTMMELPLTSQWHQDSPYNDQCPVLTPGTDEHTVVGCNATALAQILNYWQWPITGTSANTTTYYFRWRTNWDEQPLATSPGSLFGWEDRLQWTSAGGGRLRLKGYWDTSLYDYARKYSSDANYKTALEALWNRLTRDSTICSVNFASTTYNWNLLQDTHTDPVDAGDVEVAKLCYHAGVAIFSSYGYIETSGWGPNVVSAYENYFRYDQDAIIEDRDLNKMVEEIQWLRAVNFFGRNSGDEGHAWVLLGYNKGTSPWQFKMNLGWGGASGWYTCDNVQGFNLKQGHITLIAPLMVKFVGNSTSGDGSPDSPYKNIEEAVANAPDDATLIFKAGSDNTFSASTLVINRPLTLKGKDVIIRKQ
ncbi:MAG: C10 family peptidase [candidate division KSB1 bacterium]|nr:C10 family peptidase [candidate division KSB1 bacterium]